MHLNALHDGDALESTRLRIIERRAQGKISRGSSAHAPYFEWAGAFSDKYENVEAELGIPRSILDVGAMLYESLHPDEAVELPLRLIDLIPCGADLTPAFFRLITDMLVHPEVGAIRFGDEDEQHLLQKLSALLTPALPRQRFIEAWDQVAHTDQDGGLSVRGWPEHTRYGIYHLMHLAIATIGAKVHNELDLAFMIRKVVHWNLTLATFAARAKVSPSAACHTPELQEVGYIAYREAARPLTERYLEIVTMTPVSTTV
jgi:hypothetical protein